MAKPKLYWYICWAPSWRPDCLAETGVAVLASARDALSAYNKRARAIDRVHKGRGPDWHRLLESKVVLSTETPVDGRISAGSILERDPVLTE